MDYSTLTNKTEKELHDMLAEKREHLRELRHKDSEHQLKKVHTLSEVKRDIARILTALQVRHSTAE